MKSTQHLTACDLMSGDWVQIVPDAPAMANEYHRIDWIRTGEIGLDNRNIVTYPYIQPIPLTPEILEKNGWHKFQMYYRLGIDKQQYMEYYPHLGRLQRIYKHKNNKEEVVFTCGALYYVHLLQHALRLCGVSKEIVI